MVTIIIPVYNVKKFLDKAIRSAVGQTYLNLEIILVDDGSKDQSGTMCDAWEEKDRRITVIHKENGGLSSARNAALGICHIYGDRRYTKGNKEKEMKVMSTSEAIRYDLGTKRGAVSACAKLFRKDIFASYRFAEG